MESIKIIVKIKLSKLILVIAFILTGQIACKKEIVIESNSTEFGTLFNHVSPLLLADIINTPDNGYLLCGTVVSGELGMTDGFLLKVDESFNKVWYKSFGGMYEDGFSSIALDDKGNIMVVGISLSFGASLDTIEWKYNPLMYAVYVDQNGLKIWEKTMQANPTAKNRQTYARKVLYLNNDNFVVLGQTDNFTNNTDIFAVCLEPNANIIWSRRFNTIPTPSYPYDFIQNACVTDDNNILIQMRVSDYQNDLAPFRINKVSKDGSGFSTNVYLNQGKNINDIIKFENDSYEKFPMSSCGGDQMAIYNEIDKGIAIIGSDGNISSRINYSDSLEILDMYRKKNSLVVLGNSIHDGIKELTIMVTDLQGQTLRKVTLNTGINLFKRLTPTKAFLNNDNSISLIGRYTNTNQVSIILLKFDETGKLKTTQK